MYIKNKLKKINKRSIYLIKYNVFRSKFKKNDDMIIRKYRYKMVINIVKRTISVDHKILLFTKPKYYKVVYYL